MLRRAHPHLLSLCAVLAPTLLAGGCIEREGIPVSPCTSVSFDDVQSVTNIDQVNLLFMVDNSGSMREEQESLVREFPRMVNILASGDANEDGDTDDPEDFEPARSLNVAVITSDMGVGGATGVRTCERSEVGDDGLFRFEGSSILGSCDENYDPVLNYQPAVAGSDPASFAAAASCIATVGTRGCGYEQQLEAVLKALSPVSPTDWTAPNYQRPGSFFGNRLPHGDGANAGFMRPDAVLALILVTDEEDCSAEVTDLFNPSSTTFTGPPNLRCFSHGSALFPVSRYVRGYLNLVERPNLLVYAPIVGIPVDLAPGRSESPDWNRLIGPDGVRDDRLIERIDPSDPDALTPSCRTARGEAYPPIRISQVAQSLQNEGAGVTIQSICQDSFRPALDGIIDQIRQQLGESCLPRPLNTEANGGVNCEINVTMPGNMDCDDLANSTEVDIAQGLAVCNLPQLVPSIADIEARRAPEGQGWFYDDFTAEGAAQCMSDPFQRLAFTVQPPNGAEVRLLCFSGVATARPGVVEVGAFCDPDAGGDAYCDQGATPEGDQRLTCDPVARACGVPCETDANCRDAGLVGFVCDDRDLSTLLAAGEGSGPHNICVNPTCG